MSDATTILTPSLLSIWLMGISVGVTSCAATCLPFLGTWTFGRGRGGVSALGDTALFLTGKILAYSALGAAAGLLGDWISGGLSGRAGHLAIGGSSIVAGLWLMVRKERSRCCGPSKSRDALPPFLLGFSMSLVPCAPLASLLALCALGGNGALGAGYGALFGLGTALTPLLMIMPLVGIMSHTMTLERPWLGQWLRMGAGVTLCLLGVRRLMLGV
ncbi:MAG: sulfite exporter TauE/SafE family protein [Magnetococcales bacterium]|nr:sulfite exporter TauE/SafE family protein [Magnetococcales bacterium]